MFSAAALVTYSSVSESVWGTDPLINGCVLALVGAVVAGVDSILAGPAVQDAVEHQFEPGREAGMTVGEAMTTAVGIVNGFGGLGTILQGTMTSYIAKSFGWDYLFFVLVALCVAAAVALLPTIHQECTRTPPHQKSSGIELIGH